MKLKSSISKLLTAAFISTALTAPIANAKFKWEDYYEISDIKIDKNIDPQIGGLAVMPDGRLIACFHRGEVAIYDESTEKWQIFANGLHEPLGIYVEKDGAVLVMQRSEITRLRDSNKDGVADEYQVVSNDWGLTGNYHEFGFGLVQDSKGNIYVTLGTASNGSGVRREVRGEWNNASGLEIEDFLNEGTTDEWNEKKKSLPRMYSRTPYRGCVLQIKPGNPNAIVYATGLRTPNGLYMDKNDQLWVTDNQGDWVGSSKLHRIEKGGFHGHPASLLWSKNPPKETPADLPPKMLDNMRVRAAALLPQGEAGNSITQPLGVNTNFMPLTTSESKDQLIIGEMNHPRLVYYMPDTVNGKTQGASTHIIDTQELLHGNNRMAYSLDGKSMYIGKTHLSWPGREGIKKITFKEKPYLLADKVELTKTGFKFSFNADITAPDVVERYLVKSFGNTYTSSYGSKKVDEKREAIESVIIEGNTLLINLKNPPKQKKIYDITLSKKVSSELSDIASNRFWYTAQVVQPK